MTGFPFVLRKFPGWDARAQQLQAQCGSRALPGDIKRELEQQISQNRWRVDVPECILLDLLRQNRTTLTAFEQDVLGLSNFLSIRHFDTYSLPHSIQAFNGKDLEFIEEVLQRRPWVGFELEGAECSAEQLADFLESVFSDRLEHLCLPHVYDAVNIDFLEHLRSPGVSRQLQSLILATSNTSERVFHGWIQSVELPNLQTFGVAFTQISVELIEALSHSSFFRQLSTLSVTSYTIDEPEATEAFFQMLPQMPALRCLDIRRLGFPNREGTMRVLSSYSGYLSNLEKILVDPIGIKEEQDLQLMGDALPELASKLVRMPYFVYGSSFDH
jgi:hypothetical protein